MVSVKRFPYFAQGHTCFRLLETKSEIEMPVFIETIFLILSVLILLID